MPNAAQPKSFREQIQARLETARAEVDQQLDRMDNHMVVLEKREEQFNDIADRLIQDVVCPALEEFASHLDNAELDDSGHAHRVRCKLRHCDRFPAQAHVELRVTHNDSIEEVRLEYHAEILPVFIQYERDDAINFALDSVDGEAASSWAEAKLLGFLDSYLPIETHPQYQHDNYVLDPVCGMRIMKTKAMSLEHAGHTVYFCAKVCLDRFAAHPEEFSSFGG